MDGPISDGLSNLINMTSTMLLKLSAVILFTPSFLLPGVLLAVVGGWIGQVYIKAQLSVKREMSVAKAPVLAHFGAAMAGIGSCFAVKFRFYGAHPSTWQCRSVLMVCRSHSGRSPCIGSTDTLVRVVRFTTLTGSYPSLLPPARTHCDPRQVGVYPYRRRRRSIFRRAWCIPHLWPVAAYCGGYGFLDDNGVRV